MNEKIMKQEATYDFLKDEVHCLYEENQNLKEDFKRHIDRINELTNRIDKAIEKLKEHKQDLDYEPWSIYQIEGNILFDLVDILKGSDSNDNNR